MRSILILFCIFLSFQLYTCAQETIINVSISQPKKLTVETGGDLFLSPGDSVFIGESISVSGGTPDYSYLWEDAGGTFYNKPTFWGTILGQYTFTVTDTKNCTASDHILVLTMGFEEDPASSYFTIFPNPSDGLFMLQINNGQGPDGDLQVFNTGGKLLLQIPGKTAGAASLVTVDLRACGPGIYLLHYPVDGQSFVKPLLIR